MSEPSLTSSVPDGAVRGAVLMLHGGAAKGIKPVAEGSLSWRRSHRMMHEIQDDLHDSWLAVHLLRYRLKGWNMGADRLPSPVPDARWALARLRELHGEVPVVLLGHSMGARTAVAVADDPAVVGVVALAPWLPVGEPVDAVAGRHLAAAHGRRDRITSARATADFVARAQSRAASVEMHDMGRVGHYMLRDASAWNEFAVSRTLRQLRVGTAERAQRS